MSSCRATNANLLRRASMDPHDDDGEGVDGATILKARCAHHVTEADDWQANLARVQKELDAVAAQIQPLAAREDQLQREKQKWAQMQHAASALDPLREALTEIGFSFEGASFECAERTAAVVWRAETTSINLKVLDVDRYVIYVSVGRYSGTGIAQSTIKRALVDAVKVLQDVLWDTRESLQRSEMRLIWLQDHLDALRTPPPLPAQRVPVQADKYGPAGTIPWVVHHNAWENYAAQGHGHQSAAQIAARGGFSHRELQCALAGHYNQTARCKEEHDPVPCFSPYGAPR
jgi:hypothetical protein